MGSCFCCNGVRMLMRFLVRGISHQATAKQTNHRLLLPRARQLKRQVCR